MRTNFDDYEFRCSDLGKIVPKSSIGLTDNQSKELEELEFKLLTKGLTDKQKEKKLFLEQKRDNPELSEGVKTYLQELFIGEIYGTRKEAFGKALDKGVFCEEDGITMIGNTLLKGELVLKNKERKRNGFIHGETDLFKNKTVYDVKNALDLFTFGKADITWDYDWQLVGYAWLWGAEKAVLFYCLNNMPAQMIEEEKKALYWRNKWKYESMECRQYLDDCKRLEQAHNYDHIPLAEKFKFWEIDISQKRIDQLKESIKQARIYLNELLQEHLDMIEKNLKYV